MDSYYEKQTELPHHSSVNRQRGSGIGALVAGVGRVALPFAKRFLLPAAKKIGRDLLVEGLPELFDVVRKRKTPKQALKSTVKKTARKQIGGGRVNKRRRRRQSSKRKQTSRKRNNNTLRKVAGKRSRLNFFSNVKHDY